MKNKGIITMLCAILILAGFSAGMTQARDNGTFAIQDIEGQREYLNVFPIEGVMADATHGMIFQIVDGEASCRYLPYPSEVINTLFQAERAGIQGWEKYSYHEFGFDTPYTVSAPSADATVEEFDGIHPDVMERLEWIYGNREIKSGDSAVTDQIDIYMIYDTWDEPQGSFRMWSGMTMADKEYYYTRAYESDDKSSGMWFDYESYSEEGLTAYCYNIGGRYYAIAASNENCRGETRLFSFAAEDSYKNTDRDWDTNPPMYSDAEYGDVQILQRFPVDATNRIMGMVAAGDQHMGIFRVAGDELYFELYDLQGKLVDSILLAQGKSSSFDEITSRCVIWADGDVSLLYEAYRITEQEGESLVMEQNVIGMLQLNEEGLKHFMLSGDGGMLSVCKNNLILIAGPDFYDDMESFPYQNYQEFYLTVTNAETQKVLYRGKLETDMKEDYLKLVSEYDIAKSRGYLQEGKNQEINVYSGDVYKRIRQIQAIAIIDGRRESRWLR